MVNKIVWLNAVFRTLGEIQTELTQPQYCKFKRSFTVSQRWKKESAKPDLTATKQSTHKNFTPVKKLDEHGVIHWLVKNTRECHYEYYTWSRDY